MAVEAAVEHLAAADVVGFSAYIWNIRLSLAIARALKQRYPEKLIVNPAVVVLGGFLAIIAEHDLPGLVDLVRAQCMPACAEDLRILPAALAEDRLLIGAAEAVFTDLINNRLMDRL